MSLISIELLCDPDKQGCGHEWDAIVERDDRNREDVECPGCHKLLGMRAYRSIKFMSVKRHLSAAEVAKDAPLKESLRLEVEAAKKNPNSTERKDMEKEIKYLKSTTGPKT